MDPNSSRSARLSTAERKRLTDRKAQRQRRERIKTYIARLEQTLEDLTAASGGGMEATLLKQLEQQRSKTERLTNVINHIQEVLEETRGSASPTPETPLLTQGESSISAPSLPPSIPRRLLNPLEDNNNNSNHNNRRAPFTISADLATRISLHSQNPSNSGTRNYFEIVNETIANVCKEQNSIVPSTTADDDDLAIRAILHGWDSVRDGGRTLDRVWGLLQALDQGIFSETGMVERVAVLRLMRSMIKVLVTTISCMLPTEG